MACGVGGVICESRTIFLKILWHECCGILCKCRSYRKARLVMLQLSVVRLGERRAGPAIWTCLRSSRFIARIWSEIIGSGDPMRGHHVRGSDKEKKAIHMMLMLFCSFIGIQKKKKDKKKSCLYFLVTGEIAYYKLMDERQHEHVTIAWFDVGSNGPDWLSSWNVESDATPIPRSGASAWRLVYWPNCNWGDGTASRGRRGERVSQVVTFHLFIYYLLFNDFILFN